MIDHGLHVRCRQAQQTHGGQMAPQLCHAVQEPRHRLLVARGHVAQGAEHRRPQLAVGHQLQAQVQFITARTHRRGQGLQQAFGGGLGVQRGDGLGRFVQQRPGVGAGGWRPTAQQGAQGRHADAQTGHPVREIGHGLQVVKAHQPVLGQLQQRQHIGDGQAQQPGQGLDAVQEGEIRRRQRQPTALEVGAQPGALLQQGDAVQPGMR